MWLNLEPSNTSATILCLNQMLNNMPNDKLAYDAHQLVNYPSKFSLLLKHMQNQKIYWKFINWSMNMYLLNCQIYAEGLLINMSHFYIHYGLL